MQSQVRMAMRGWGRWAGALGALLFGISFSATSGAAEKPDYLGAVRRGAALLARGQAPEARRAFLEARDLDMNDALALVGLGYALDVEGQPTEARGELDLALKLDAGKTASCRWAMALMALNNGRLEETLRQLDALRQQSAPALPDYWVTLAYARCASGSYQEALKALEPLGALDALDAPLRSAAGLVTGAAAFATGQYARAVEMLRLSARSLPPDSFFDAVPRRRAPILPEAHTTQSENIPLVSAPSLGPSVRTCSGVVRLYVDPFRFPTAAFATIKVDGRAIHTTNAQPLRYDWNTRTVPNGYHKVVVRVDDATGECVGQTEEVLLVSNTGVSFPPAYPEEEYARTDRELQQAMALQPDPLSTHYLLGLSLLKVGDSEGAAAELEMVMARDPEFGRARSVLRSIYAARNGHQVRTVSSVPTTARKIAVTFDDGPHPLYTPPLLDLLERYRARCTMFLVGVQVEAFPDIAREIVEKGHEVANHTYSHPNLQSIDRRAVEMELLRNRAVLRRVTGRSVDLFRPPGGHADKAIEAVAAEYGLTTVYWDLFDSWLQKYDERTVLQKLLGAVKPGSIILLHNGSNKTGPILEPFFEELTRQGYQCVTVSELLREMTPGAVPPTEAPEAPELRDEVPNEAMPAAPAPRVPAKP